MTELNNGTIAYRGGKPSMLEDDAYLQLVAECVVAGLRNAEAAEQCNCHRDTYSGYKKDPRVKAVVAQLWSDRSRRIAAQAERAIEDKMENADELTVKELLEIARTFAAPKGEGATDEAAVLKEMADAIDANPDLGKALTELTNGKK